MKVLSFAFSGAFGGLPTLIWHGMGDNGMSSGMQRIKMLVEENTGNTAKTIVIGNNAEEDRLNGFWKRFLKPNIFL